MTESNNPGVIVRGMSFPKTCDGCRFLLADTFEAPFVGFHTAYSCMAVENQLEAGVPDGLRTSGRLEACPLEPLPEEIHTDCRIDLGPVWIRTERRERLLREVGGALGLRDEHERDALDGDAGAAEGGPKGILCNVANDFARIVARIWEDET